MKVHYMSFARTIEQIKRREKTVTRRKGWLYLKPGDRLLACCTKTMGVRAGEKLTVIGTLKVVSVRREPLKAVTLEEVRREGFPGLDRVQYIERFAQAERIRPDDLVT